MDKILIIGGLGVVGFLLYRLTEKQSGMDQPNQAYQNIGTQSSTYPYQAVQAPRSDYGTTANQPWTPTANTNAGNKGSSAGSLLGVDLSLLQGLSTANQAIGDISDIWDSVSSWFAEEPEALMGGFDWSSSGWDSSLEMFA